MTISSVFESFQQMHVVVIGDVMLDKYIYGSTDRISPEAPVPVVDVRKQETRLGGAANVALNCKALGAKVTLASVVGNDDDAQLMLELLQSHDIATDLIQKSDTRPTTVKQRIMSRNQQLLRLDFETTADLDTTDEHPFIDRVMRYVQVQKPDMVIFEDYNKGVLKANVINRILGHCITLGIPTAVDPKKVNFFNYKGITIFKPNLKEVKEGLDWKVLDINIESLNAVHEALAEQLQHQISFITLSERGVYVHDQDAAHLYPTYIRNIADVSGAGDTVIAVGAMTYVATRNAGLMAQWANVAGGLVCETVGVVPIEAQQLERELEQLALHP